MSYASTHIQIMDMRFSAHVSTEEFELWLSQVERFFLKQQHFVLVMQTEPVTEFPEQYRQLQATWYKRYKQDFFQYCLGLVRIAQDPADQQRLNAPSLHAAWRVPYYVTLDRTDALLWAVQRWLC
ncbi:hypothetical protein D7V64_01730 [Acinetobacter cumulans]|uniref:Protein ActB n=1 Tax=Acinetobacter cumulans TaxID=2136182 RepID=A0A3A8GJ22_9GAMM|nr:MULTISPECIES: hypothetical protein [Acinetobacter]RKG45801.1 hypothetical protein D7V51_03920 [Acinetobacter cumulans]RKG55064.1 hypothetical protein D7V64_01730 [Acinetobacter cumulans]RZG60977.1 hypothetical protein EXE29_03945 [Acinetobacter sp. WCHAc060006]